MATILVNATESTEVAATFKIVLVGDSGVGKTNLLASAEGISLGSGPDAHDVDATRSTVGVELASIIFEVKDGTKIKAQIWDTAGQERFQSLGVAFFRGADACILVYDMTNPKSFESLDKWRKDFLQNVSDDPPPKKTNVIFICEYQ